MSKQLSISDDDLCAKCAHCAYNPGGLSTCGIDRFDDAIRDEGGDYIEHCLDHQETRAFTITLMYPDYLAAQFGETWMGTETVPYDSGNPAEAVKAAVAAARKTCISDNGWTDDDVQDVEDFDVVCVVEGDHEDLRYLLNN